MTSGAASSLSGNRYTVQGRTVVCPRRLEATLRPGSARPDPELTRIDVGTVLFRLARWERGHAS